MPCIIKVEQNYIPIVNKSNIQPRKKFVPRKTRSSTIQVFAVVCGQLVLLRVASLSSYEAVIIIEAKYEDLNRVVYHVE